MSFLDYTRRQSGQSLVEFATLLPLIILLIIGAAETGNALNAYIGVTNAAREGVRLAARGNIYSDAQIKQVIKSQTQYLDLEAHGSIVMTVVRSNTTGFVSYTTSQLLGASTSRFNASSLATLHQLAISTANKVYLSKERFIVMEVFYNCPTLTRFIWSSIPLYSYSVMQVSAAS